MSIPKEKRTQMTQGILPPIPMLGEWRQMWLIGEAHLGSQFDRRDIVLLMFHVVVGMVKELSNSIVLLSRVDTEVVPYKPHCEIGSL